MTIYQTLINKIRIGSFIAINNKNQQASFYE